MKPFFVHLAFVCAGLLAPAAVRACSVCYGDPESPLTHGVQKGVLTLLFIVYGVVVGLGAMFGFVAVRAKQRQARRKKPCLRCRGMIVEYGDIPEQ